MPGPSDDWVFDEALGGPYGYNAVLVQRDGIRLSCDSPVVPTDPRGLYDALVATQQRLIEAAPRTLAEAFIVTAGGTLPPRGSTR
jgi:hypothetical protein